MATLIELDNRVLELTVTPGTETPGRCRRKARIVVLSGPPLTAEEVARIRLAVTRLLIDSGARVYGWGVEP